MLKISYYFEKINRTTFFRKCTLASQKRRYFSQKWQPWKMRKIQWKHLRCNLASGTLNVCFVTSLKRNPTTDIFQAGFRFFFSRQLFNRTPMNVVKCFYLFSKSNNYFLIGPHKGNCQSLIWEMLQRRIRIEY